VRSFEWRSGAEKSRRPFVLERALVSLELDGEGAERAGRGDLVLRRWELPSGEFRSERVLAKDVTPRLVASADRRAVLVGLGEAWTIYALESGSRLGQLPKSDYLDFAVVGSRALALVARAERRDEKRKVTREGRALVATSLEGAPLWEYPVEGPVKQDR
jgi:hypothetical protein